MIGNISQKNERNRVSKKVKRTESPRFYPERAANIVCSGYNVIVDQRRRSLQYNVRG